MDTSNYLISESFYIHGDYNNRVPILLNPDKSVNPQSWVYPIEWTGRIGQLNVVLIQKSREEIDFSPIPSKMRGAIEHIHGAVDRLIRSLEL